MQNMHDEPSERELLTELERAARSFIQACEQIEFGIQTRDVSCIEVGEEMRDAAIREMRRILEKVE
jgi:hypothetical protein